MKIALHDVAKGRPRARALPPTTTTFSTGHATLAEAETEQRPTVLGLIASGRMTPDEGTVMLDGRPDAATLRRVVALVDAPDVCDPAPDVTVIGLVEEELMFAGRSANLRAARRWLDENGFAELGRMPISTVAPRERVALLMELTALRADVAAMVLVSPDRHGGSPHDWWDVAAGFAARGYAVLAIAGVASAQVLADRIEPPAPDDEDARADRRGGGDDAPAPSADVSTPASYGDIEPEPDTGPDADPDAVSNAVSDPAPEPDGQAHTAPEPDHEPDADTGTTTDTDTDTDTEGEAR